VTICEDQLRSLGFHLTHVCQSKGSDSAQFTQSPDADSQILQSCEPMIYVWLSPNQNGLDAMYVGKAGLGVSQRMKQHESGFRYSTSGRKNLQSILSLMNENRSLLVYARKSDSAVVLGVKGINMYSAEEEAAYELFHPLWNRAEFSTSRQNASNTKKEKAILKETKIVEEFETFTIGPVDFTNCARVELLRTFFEGLEEKNKLQFIELLKWTLDLKEKQGTELKIVKGYINQPKGYNNIATLLVSPLTISGRAIHKKWIMRVPLRSDKEYPLTVILPINTLSTAVKNNEISQGEDDCFRPLNLEAFFKNPRYFTNLK
jgi:hypothetical protein